MNETEFEKVNVFKKEILMMHMQNILLGIVI